MYMFLYTHTHIDCKNIDVRIMMTAYNGLTVRSAWLPVSHAHYTSADTHTHKVYILVCVYVCIVCMGSGADVVRRSMYTRVVVVSFFCFANTSPEYCFLKCTQGNMVCNVVFCAYRLNIYTHTFSTNRVIHTVIVHTHRWIEQDGTSDW